MFEKNNRHAAVTSYTVHRCATHNLILKRRPHNDPNQFVRIVKKTKN